MKPKKTFQYCENCNKAWEILSPPSKEAYESGMIEIRSGDLGQAIMLLPEKPGRTSYAFWFAGIYCNVKCLSDYLNKILDKKVI